MSTYYDEGIAQNHSECGGYDEFTDCACSADLPDVQLLLDELRGLKDDVSELKPVKRLVLQLQYELFVLKRSLADVGSGLTDHFQIGMEVEDTYRGDQGFDFTEERFHSLDGNRESIWEGGAEVECVQFGSLIDHDLCMDHSSSDKQYDSLSLGHSLSRGNSMEEQACFYQAQNEVLLSEGPRAFGSLQFDSFEGLESRARFDSLDLALLDQSQDDAEGFCDTPEHEDEEALERDASIKLDEPEPDPPANPTVPYLRVTTDEDRSRNNECSFMKRQFDADEVMTDEWKIQALRLYRDECEEQRKVIFHLHESVDFRGHPIPGGAKNLEVTLISMTTAIEYPTPLDYVVGVVSDMLAAVPGRRTNNGDINQILIEHSCRLNMRARTFEVEFSNGYVHQAKKFMRDIQEVLRNDARLKRKTLWIKSVAVSKPPQLRHLRKWSARVRGRWSKVANDLRVSGQVRNELVMKETKIYAEVAIIGDPTAAFKQWVNVLRFKWAVFLARGQGSLPEGVVVIPPEGGAPYLCLLADFRDPSPRRYYFPMTEDVFDRFCNSSNQTSTLTSKATVDLAANRRVQEQYQYLDDDDESSVTPRITPTEVPSGQSRESSGSGLEESPDRDAIAMLGELLARADGGASHRPYHPPEEEMGTGWRYYKR